MKPFSETQTEILKFLATYKFLIVPQFQRLGLSNSPRKFQHHLREIERKSKNIMGRIVFGMHPKLGKLHNVFYLKPNGAIAVSELQKVDISEIRYPVGRQFFFHDYFHRIHTVDFHIAFRTWAKDHVRQLDFFDTYFDKAGSNRNPALRGHSKAKTRVSLKGEALIPDAVYSYLNNEGKRQLVVFEMCNKKETKRIVVQFEKHVMALHEGAFSKKYGYEVANRVFAVFEYESILSSVRQRMRKKETFEGVEKFFVFNLIKNLRQNFLDGWETIEGKSFKMV